MVRDTRTAGPHPVDRHVRRRVCEKRLSLGHNQSDLARALGLTFQQVQKYEKGANRISASKLWDIAGFLKVDIGYFFAGLDQARGGADADENPPTDVAATRHSIEIARLVPQLTTSQQRLARDLITSMLAPV